jgi:catechol 2,3-dioxygenase-like lactoylglutathione lyase family enzyme
MTTQSQQDTSVKLKIVEMDHIVIRVKDVEKAIEFYTEVLGLTPMRVEEYRAGSVPFPCARINGDTIIDLFPFPDQEPVGEGPRNMDHYCLVIEPTDLAHLADHLRERGVTVVSDGPAQRSGARGMGESIYIRDWEGNNIELRHY